jgi:uncharacterized protein (DUF1330 family)
MAAYVIGELTDVTDSAGFEESRRRVPATIERYGGRFIVRRGRMETLDGARQPEGLVVTEFPTMEQANAWHDSVEYRELMALRRRTARINLVLVDGVSTRLGRQGTRPAAARRGNGAPAPAREVPRLTGARMQARPAGRWPPGGPSGGRGGRRRGRSAEPRPTARDSRRRRGPR